MSSFRKQVLDKAKHSLRFLPDEVFLKLYYRIRFGKPLDLKNPQTFTEKLQWLKLHDRDPLYTTLADKYEVKKWVSSRIGDQYIVPTLGVWDNFDSIAHEDLPEQFVLKCTHDSGGLSICRDKSTFDFIEARRKIEASLRANYYYISREWPYKNIQPRILAEEYLEDRTDSSRAASKEMVDYKFYCFHGTPRFLTVSQGLENRETARSTFLDVDWTPATLTNRHFVKFDEFPRRPKSYSEMLDIVEKLAQGIPFVRVDLYEVSGRPLFSEMTFQPGGGFMSWEPESWNTKIGSWINLKAIGEQDGV